MLASPEPPISTEQFLGLPISFVAFGKTTNPAVNAAQLHAYLQTKATFLGWYKYWIIKQKMVEGVDFVHPEDAISPNKPGSLNKRLWLNLMLNIPAATRVVTQKCNVQSAVLSRYLLSQSTAQSEAGIETEIKTATAIAAVTTPKPMPMPKPTITHGATAAVVATVPLAAPTRSPKGRKTMEHKKPVAPAPNPAADFEPVEVANSMIGGMPCPVVDGRALWEKLGVGRDFNYWIRTSISEYDFVEGRDFAVDNDSRGALDGLFAKSAGSSRNNRPAENYRLTLAMAKELAMVERTPQGRQARRYFLECERKLASTTAASAATIPAAPVQQHSLTQSQASVPNDSMDMADVKVLCALIKARADRTWLLVMRQYGANLLLSRDEKASETLALAIQDRLYKQLKKEIDKLDGAFFDEPAYSELVSMIGQWAPSND